MIAICPHCEEEITRLEYRADYSETSFGRTYGHCDLHGDNSYVDEIDQQHTDNYEESDIEYYCPLCDEEIGLEELEIMETIERVDNNQISTINKTNTLLLNTILSNQYEQDVS